MTEAKINVEEQIENLEKRLKQPVPDLKVQHVGLEVADVQQLTRMAAQRIKPFNANGHGFRDSAIWVTLMRYAQSVDRTVGFISENKNDFGSDGILLPELQEQLKSQSISNIHYFNSLADFLAKHLLREDKFDIQPFKDQIFGFGSEISLFSRELHAASKKDIEDGEWLNFDEAMPFNWEIKNFTAYRVNENVDYLRVTATAKVNISIVWVSAQYVDPIRNKSYENTESRPITIKVQGELGVRILQRKRVLVEVLNLEYLGLEDSK